MFPLVWLLVSDVPAYRATVILVGLARCIAMVLIRTDLASGAQELGALLAVLNATCSRPSLTRTGSVLPQRAVADTRFPVSTGLLPLRPRDLLGADRRAAGRRRMQLRVFPCAYAPTPSRNSSRVEAARSLPREAVAQRWVPWRISKSRVGCLLAEAVYARLAAIQPPPGVN